MRCEKTIAEATATGLQLISELRHALRVAERFEYPRMVGGPILKLLEKSHPKMERLEALRALAVMLDPIGEKSAWAICGEIESAIQRFESAAYRRVKSGHREPTGIESLLLVLIESEGAKCQQRLFDLLSSE